MERLLFAAMTAFGRVFLVTFLVAATGILTAPDQAAAIALSWAALVASIVAGLRAIQIFIPGITFARFFSQPLAAWIDSFTLAFVGVFVTLAMGWLAAPDWSNWKAGVSAVVIGALTAGVRALQGALTPGEAPGRSTGIANPGGAVKV